MTDIDKFLADAERTIKHGRRDGYDAEKICVQIEDLFSRQIKHMGAVPQAVCNYWRKTYIEESSAEGKPAREHLEWLADALSFFCGSAENTGQFTEQDWQELHRIINDEAGSLPIDTLSELMGIFLARGVI